MSPFYIKIILMPLIIAGVTIVARKWGNTIGGIIGSMPWVAGPILFFIAKDHGAQFAMAAVPGILVGIIAWLVFVLVYIWAGQYYNPIITTLLGYTSYLVVGKALLPLSNYLVLELWLAITLTILTTAYLIFPKVTHFKSEKYVALQFEIPLRMIVVTVFVIVITYFSETLGPNWSGVLTPFPILTSVLAVFTHYTQGMVQVRTVLYGLLIGIFGFTLFMYTQASLLAHFSIHVSFLMGAILNLLVTFTVRKFTSVNSI